MDSLTVCGEPLDCEIVTLLPNVVIGTSCLGNLFKNIGHDAKQKIVSEVIFRNKQHGGDRLIFDSAGKYGCGLALETLGRILQEMQVRPQEVRVSNKLGWRRVPLASGGAESCLNLEPGVWIDLDHDGR